MNTQTTKNNSNSIAVYGRFLKLLKRLSFSLFVLLPLMLACSGEKKEVQNDSDIAAETASVKPEPKDSLVIELIAPDSLSVLALLERSHKVEKLTTAGGAFVKAIDSLENGSSVFWLYSVNGEMGKVASDLFLAGAGDTVRWHFRIFDEK